MAEKSRNAMVITGSLAGKQIIQELLNSKVKIVAMATTRFKKDYIEEHDDVVYVERRLTAEGIVRLAEKYNVQCIIDASHFFAKDISTNAMRACKRLEIKYIRYEKPLPDFDDPNKRIKKVDSYGDLVKALSKKSGNAFITVGTQNMHHFKKLIKKEAGRLFFKVVPESKELAKCEELGIGSGNLIALKGCLSETMYVELINRFGAEIMVLKESGEAGGYEEKMNAALKTDLKIIVLKRPEIEYSLKVSTIAEVIYMVGISMAQAKD